MTDGLTPASAQTPPGPDDPRYSAHIPIDKIEALLAAATAFAMSPTDVGHGHIIPTLALLSEQVCQLRRVLYGPRLGP